VRKLGWAGIWLLLAALVTAVALVALGRISTVSDDGYITLVYARHLSVRGGTYWNLGDGPIDGFTSALDVFVKAATLLLCPSDPIRAVWWVTLVYHLGCALAGLGLAAALARGLSPGRQVALALLGGLTIASSTCLASGSRFVLETPLFGLLELLALALLLRSEKQSSASACALAVLLALLSMTRPEGLPLAIIFLLYFTYSQRSAPVRRLATPLVVFSGLIAVYYGWRLKYFGYWAPNTYYAKRSSSLWNELDDGFTFITQLYRKRIDSAVLVTTVVGAPALLWRRFWLQDQQRARYAALSLTALLSLFLVVAEGGDGYRIPRFLAPANVLAVTALMIAAVGLAGRKRLVPVGALVVLLASQLAAISPNLRWTSRLTTPLDRRQFACEQEAANSLQTIAPNLAVAETDYQRLKFFGDSIHVIDLHGLNDRQIAHQIAPGHVVWGKFTYEEALRVDAPIWIYGVSPLMHGPPMADVSIADLLLNRQLFMGYTHYLEYHHDTLGTQIMSDAALHGMVERYQTASLRVCRELYLNFLARRDVAPMLARAGVLVGK
jgi:hypothetical protein